ncbi:hypothetical protein ABI59_10105 [Acidobacteria bacterium Mor1]|nr:hypothetical protein ABI59_10105 [Acidobacteria bacterium Mor1]
MSLKRTMSVFLLLCAAATGLAAQPAFVELPADTIPTDVSADGTQVVGWFEERETFLWNAGEGFRNLGGGCPLVQFPVAGRPAISADGTRIFGCTYVDRRSHIGRWLGGAEWEVVSDEPAYLLDVDALGSVVVGQQVGTFQASAWDLQSGEQQLFPGNGLSRVNAVSADGSVLVGYETPPGGRVGLVWQDGQAVELVSGGVRLGAGRAVNDDGTVVFGRGWDLRAEEGGGFAWRWFEAEGFARLGLTGHDKKDGGFFALETIPQDTDSAGKTMVGYVGFMRGSTDLRVAYYAVVWTEEFGFERVAAPLNRAGVRVPDGWELVEATAISDDGSTIVGWGTFDGESRGWLIRLW